MLLVVRLNRVIQPVNILVGLIQLLLFLGQLSQQILRGLITSCVIVQQPLDFGFQLSNSFVSDGDLAVFTLNDQILLADLLL
jgi:hypothetical protein